MSTKSLPRGAVLLAAVVWIVLRYIDFSTGFVETSRFRFLVAILSPILFLVPYLDRFGIVRKAKARLEKIDSSLTRKQKATLSITLLLTFAVLGYTLFLSRLHRGAHMGDTPLFQQSVETTAGFSGLLYNNAEGGSHFKAHNSPFLLLFVPVVWMFGRNGWLLIQFFHSLVILIWAYTIGVTVGKLVGSSLWIWPLTFSLFLATYTQHATFYDTRFAALGLALFISGLLLKKSQYGKVGFIASLLSRETAALAIASALIGATRRMIRPRLKWTLIWVSLLWVLGSGAIMHALGGPVSLGRFNECLKSPAASSTYSSCVWQSIKNDWPLKAAYTARVWSVCPAALISPAAVLGVAPDLSASWLSKDYVLYSMSWHYYMPSLSITLLFGYDQLRNIGRLRHYLNLFLYWTVAGCLWQFVTTFRFNLL